MSSAPVLCDIQPCGTERYARGLREVFGFDEVTNVWPAMSAGSLVLHFGWHDFYCQAIGRFPGLCWVLWPYGWAETESAAKGGELSVILRHLREASIGVFWAGIGDVLLKGMHPLPPVWPMQTRAAPASSGDGVFTDGSLGATLAAVAGGNLVYLSRRIVYPPVTDLAPGLHESAEVTRIVLGGVKHVVYEGPEPWPKAMVLVALRRTSWSWLVLDAIEAGVPVVGTSALAWTDHLPCTTKGLCVVDADASSASVAAVVARLVADGGLRKAVACAQGEAMDRFRSRCIEGATESLCEAGFTVG